MPNIKSVVTNHIKLEENEEIGPGVYITQKTEDTTLNVPSRVELVVEFFLDVSSNVLINERKGNDENMIDEEEKYQSSYIFHSPLAFSMLYFDRAIEATSTASCCMASDMSAFLITAFLCSAILKSITGLVSKMILGKIYAIHLDLESLGGKKQPTKKESASDCRSE